MPGLLSWLLNRRIFDLQNDLILKHYDEVQNIYRQMRGWRHDYHNHIQAIKAYIALGQTDELAAYLNELDSDLRSVDSIIKSGNIMLDAILNSKLSLAAARNIAINTKAAVPERLDISDVDMCIIVGNLLDNAIEACMRLDDENARFIRVYIGIFKEQFYISVTNAAGKEKRNASGHYESVKGGTHGFGIMRIDRIVKKYDGYVNRQNEKGVFATEIMLPMTPMA